MERLRIADVQRNEGLQAYLRTAMEKPGNKRIVRVDRETVNSLDKPAKKIGEMVLMAKKDNNGPEDWEDDDDVQKNHKKVDIEFVDENALSEQSIDPNSQYFAVKPLDFEALKQYVTPDGAPNAEAKALRKRIESVCLKIGIPAHIQGYQYICEAVYIVCYKPEAINRITKELYPTIAKQFGMTTSKVERSMRHAVSTVWKRDRVGSINELFGFEVCHRSEKLTNGEFIALLVNCCKRD